MADEDKLNFQKDIFGNSDFDTLDLDNLKGLTEEDMKRVSEEVKFAEDEERKEKKPDPKRQALYDTIFKTILFFVIALVVGAGAWYFLTPSDLEDNTDDKLREINKQYVVYNNFDFTKNKDSTWSTELFNPQTQTVYTISLHYAPHEVEFIPFDHSIKEWLAYSTQFQGNNTVGEGATFVLFDPQQRSSRQTLSYFELFRNLQEGLKIKAFPAVTNDVNNTVGLPIKHCEDSDEPMIFLKWAQPAQVKRFGENCVIVQGMGDNMVRATDRLLYTFYSIMN